MISIDSLVDKPRNNTCTYYPSRTSNLICRKLTIMLRNIKYASVVRAISQLTCHNEFVVVNARSCLSLCNRANYVTEAAKSG